MAKTDYTTEYSVFTIKARSIKNNLAIFAAVRARVQDSYVI